MSSTRGASLILEVLRFGVSHIRMLNVIFEKLQHDIWLRLSDKIEDLHSFFLFLSGDIKVGELVSRMNIVSHLLKDVKKL